MQILDDAWFRLKISGIPGCVVLQVELEREQERRRNKVGREDEHGWTMTSTFFLYFSSVFSAY